MPTRWGLFLGVAGLVTLTLLGMAYATQRALTPGAVDGGDPTRSGGQTVFPGARSTGMLLVNVVLSHGLIGSVLVATAWLAEVPPTALGIGIPSGEAVMLGAGAGGALYGAGEGAARLTDRSGIDRDEWLRRALAPATPVGWVVLLGAVLPMIAGVEELLFRGALIGAAAAGSGLPGWLLAIGSSVAFGLGHGLQGRAGMLVTGLLGLALAGVFLFTGSLVVVIVAHYVVNALEFLVHEGPGRRVGGPGSEPFE